MNENDAAQTINVAQQANAMLNMQLLELQKSLDSEEFERVKRGFGIAMGELFVEIVDPLYKAYPNLAPAMFDGTAPKVPNSHFIQVFELITSLGTRTR
jgi:hypothetical protein